MATDGTTAAWACQHSSRQLRRRPVPVTTATLTLTDSRAHHRGNSTRKRPSDLSPAAPCHPHWLSVPATMATVTLRETAGPVAMATVTHSKSWALSPTAVLTTMAGHTAAVTRATITHHIQDLSPITTAWSPSTITSAGPATTWGQAGGVGAMPRSVPTTLCLTVYPWGPHVPRHPPAPN